ncbi:MAG: hypothetical protein SF029_08430 [bacterium]|nr:hypothetical protein [bacterium]
MLVIDYVHEGHQRGYNYTSPTHGYDDATLKLIWRMAMPRGQGWGAAQFLGARSLKCFPVEGGRYALAHVVVTDQADDAGRRGIRRAEIEVLRPAACIDQLQAWLDGLSSVARATAERMLTLCQRTRIIEKTLPKFRRDPQLILTHAYNAPASWQVIEAVVLRLALNPVGMMRRWGSLIPFTTLALDYREESRIVALPAEKILQIDVPFVPLR